VTDENFRNQLSVVKEERKQRYDNTPYGLWYLTMLDMLFGGTAYGWGPIGDMSHLEAAPLDSVQTFHRSFYVPNNATLVVAGDFDREEVVKMVDELFGPIEPGPVVERRPIELVPLQQQVRRTVVDQVPLPAAYIGFQTAPICDPDSRVLGILSLILNRGRSSRLQGELVYESQIAQNVAAFNIDMEGAGLFIALAIASEDTSAQEVEDALWRELEKVRNEGVTERELQAALNHIRTSLVTSFCKLQGVADALAYYHVLCGDASRINTLLDEYATITAEDIQRVANRYLRPESAAVLHYLPKRESRLTIDD
jgi:predicted Zn-dependent peptidase